MSDTIIASFEIDKIGPKGDPGAGIATGGTTGQVLAKNSNTNFDTTWINNNVTGAAGGVLGGTYPNPSFAGTALATLGGVHNPVTADVNFGGFSITSANAVTATSFFGDGSGLTGIVASGVSGLIPRSQTDYTITSVTEAATITLAQGSRSKSTASGTLTTVAFSGSPLSSNPPTTLNLTVTNGPYTITIPTSNREGDAGSTSSLTLPNGNHELVWVYDGAAYLLIDTTYEVTVTPTSLSGDVNNYSPTGLATASVLRIDPGAADRNITGIDSTSSADGRILGIINISATKNLTLVNQSGSSSAGNKFLLPADTILPANTVLTIRYDGVSTSWRPFSRALSNTGVTAGSYGDSTHVSQITVDAAGRITSAVATAISASGTSVYPSAIPPTSDVGPFIVALVGKEFAGGAGNNNTTYTGWTVPASRRFVCTGADAVVTAVTGAATGATTFSIKTGGNAMSANQASATTAPGVGSVYVSAGASGSGVLATSAAAGATVDVVLNTAGASTSCTVTIFIRGYYSA